MAGLRMRQRVGAQLCERRDRRGADEAVEQDRNALPPRRQRRAENGGKLAAAERRGDRERIVQRGDMARERRSITARLRAKPSSSTPVPRPAQRAPPPPNKAAAIAAAAVVLPMPISPRQTRSQSGATAS